MAKRAAKAVTKAVTRRRPALKMPNVAAGDW